MPGASTVCVRIWAWTLVLMAMENAKEKTFSERNGLDEVEENDSNDTLVFDDNAHKVNLHTRSYFFCMR